MHLGHCSGQSDPLASSTRIWPDGMAYRDSQTNKSSSSSGKVCWLCADFDGNPKMPSQSCSVTNARVFRTDTCVTNSLQDCSTTVSQLWQRGGYGSFPMVVLCTFNMDNCIHAPIPSLMLFVLSPLHWHHKAICEHTLCFEVGYA